MIKRVGSILLLFFVVAVCGMAQAGFTDAASFGFSPSNSGVENAQALQKALDRQGTIVVSQSGEYKIARTLYIGSHTTLRFGNNVRLKKVNEEGPFTHVIVNKGASSKSYNQNIVIEGLEIVVNDVDVNQHKVAYGLRGQLAFFYVKDLKIERFRCYDLGKLQYCIHVCTFEDLLIDDVIVKGLKDGVHLGRGKRFKISNAVFETYDDAIALNAHDYASGNPELGWIEDGVVENCYDLNAEKTTGFFCRILAGAWKDWEKGMVVRQSDAIVSNGRIYRVQMHPDEKEYRSLIAPTHEKGDALLDGIKWGVVQEDVTYTCGVRNVVFRDIFLYKPRIGFSIHFDNDKYSRSYYPGSLIPQQELLLFENVRVLHNQQTDFISCNTPIDIISLRSCYLKSSGFRFTGNKAMNDYLPTKINMIGCVFQQEGEMRLIKNEVPQKKILLRIQMSENKDDNLILKNEGGEGTIVIVESDVKIK